MRGTRRFSEAISEGDGISLVAEVDRPEAAREAEEHGAEAIVIRQRVDGLRDATDLPVLWYAEGTLDEARDAGADAYLLVYARHGEDEGLETLHARAGDLGLDCAVAVGDDEELEGALERIDPEIFLLRGAVDADAEPLEQVLDLLPDVPAGKLAVAELVLSEREDVVALERAGVDAVIVPAADVARLVGADSP